MKFVAVFIVIVAVVYGTDPRPCDSPNQWEGSAITLIDGQERRSIFSYDKSRQRMSVVDIPEPHSPDIVSRKTLILYETRNMYRLQRGNCRVSSLFAPFRSIGISSDAAYINRKVIGLIGNPNLQLPVYTYGGSRTGRYGTEYFHGAVTVDDCIPVVHTFVFRGGKIVQANFYNITLGISNPDVFSIPTVCLSSGK